MIDTPKKYLEEQSKTSSKLLKMWQKSRCNAETGQYPFSFVEVMQQTFEKLATSDTGALELLRKFSFLHPDGIYRDLFDDDEWAHLCTLKEHSLVVDRGVAFEEVSMHAMTQTVVREHLMGGSRRTALARQARDVGRGEAVRSACDCSYISHSEGWRRAANAAKSPRGVVSLRPLCPLFPALSNLLSVHSLQRKKVACRHLVGRGLQCAGAVYNVEVVAEAETF